MYQCCCGRAEGEEGWAWSVRDRDKREKKKKRKRETYYYTLYEDLYPRLCSALLLVCVCIFHSSLFLFFSFFLTLAMIHSFRPSDLSRERGVLLPASLLSGEVFMLC